MKKERTGTDIRRVSFPYLLSKTEDGWVLVNRLYKPIGFDTSNHEIYENYPIAIKTQHLTFEKACELSWRDDKKIIKDYFDNGSIYLYNDGTFPTRSKQHMENYLKKLEAIMLLNEDFFE